MIYRLLMLGDHPYMGIPRGRGDEQILISDNIRNGISYVVAPDGVQLRASALAVDVLPADLAHSPSAPSARDTSTPPAAPRPPSGRWPSSAPSRSSSSATSNPRHVYGGHLTQCPWCARMTAGRPDLFRPDRRRFEAQAQAHRHRFRPERLVPMPMLRARAAAVACRASLW